MAVGERQKVATAPHVTPWVCYLLQGQVYALSFLAPEIFTPGLSPQEEVCSNHGVWGGNTGNIALRSWRGRGSIKGNAAGTLPGSSFNPVPRKHLQDPARGPQDSSCCHYKGLYSTCMSEMK